MRWARGRRQRLEPRAAAAGGAGEGPGEGR